MGQHGHRNMFYQTGLPGWMRLGYSPGWVGRCASGLGPAAEYLTTSQWPNSQMATQWQTIWGVVLPAARNGLMTAVMLGIGRSLGETMAVMMVTGNAATTFSGLESFITPVRTMTATIASEMGEVATGSVHYHVLFFIGIILFVFSLIINVSSTSFQGKSKQEKGQVVS